MQKNVNLGSLITGEKAKISQLDTESLPAKFYELGFVPGALVEVKHKAPFHGPICINIIANNTLIALRKSEALRITAERI
ncbi:MULTISPECIES: FeoA family protein [Sphingobacterium]|uniref:Ferrous iron transport protein A n=1 Tax=Sphingobacterium populi TaxID=1812824 RepID=A0ABW5UBD0_9SPHI|nr:FeoA family protein [Sphingobacterium sp. CFCC 11742]